MNAVVALHWVVVWSKQRLASGAELASTALEPDCRLRLGPSHNPVHR